MNKRAEADKFLEFVPRMIFLVIAFFIVGLYISFFRINHINTFEVEEETLLNRIYYSPKMISYQDPNTLRNYPGIINPSNIRTPVLEAGIKYTEEKMLAARVRLLDMKGAEVVISDPTPRSVYGYINEKEYANWEPTARAYLKGSGAYNFFQRIIPVRYIIDGELKSGRLEISIIKANS